MAPPDNQLVPLALSRGHAVGAQKSTQSRQGAKAQSQTRPELPGQIQTDSKRFKAIQTKKKKTFFMLCIKNGPPNPCPASVFLAESVFILTPKAFGGANLWRGSRWRKIKVNQA